MSGSGPSFFVKKKYIDDNIKRDEYEIFENLVSINYGVSLV